MKYIKVCDGFAIDTKTAWISHIQEKPEYTKTQGFLWLRITIQESAKFFFEFGDKKQDLTISCDTKEEAIEEWEKVLKLINDNYET